MNACKQARCGDGFVCSDASCASAPDGIEECDDTNPADNDSCLSNCVLATCGDAIVCTDPATCTTGPSGGPEQCDDGLPFVCNGASTVPAGTPCTFDHECGPGGDCTSNGDGCSEDCRSEECGDGFLDPQEECDDGNTLGGDGCDGACIAEICGNGTLQPAAGEECDDGNLTSGDGCTAACINEFCGDDIVNNVSEECEPPVDPPAPNLCRPDCTDPRCGDTIIDDSFDTNGLGGEICDDGGATIDCDPDCTPPACDDGVFNPAAEECDDTATGGTNGPEPDSCRADCTLPICGDLIADAGTDTNGAGAEQCDAGPDGDDDCTPQCCETGLDSYLAGARGAQCQVNTISTVCNIDLCKKSRAVSRRIRTMQKRVAKARELAEAAAVVDSRRKRRAAEARARSARRLAQKTVERADKLCPEDMACVEDQFGLAADMLIELGTNLALNNP